MKFNRYCDPGHSWLKVPIKLLNKLDIAQNISIASYMRGDDAYLEEDCDMGRFIKTMEEKGLSVDMKEYHTDNQSKIRSYDSFRVYTPEVLQQISTMRENLLRYTNWNKRSILRIKKGSLDYLEFLYKTYNLS